MTRCLLALVVLGSLLLTGCNAPSVVDQAIAPKTQQSAAYHGAWLDRPYAMPDVTLRDTSGQPYNLRTSPTTPITLLYLGYPGCPDACVTTMADLSAALAKLEPDVRDDITVVFVDIDTERGSGKRLKRWLADHGADFVGLTGTRGQIREIADRVGVELHEPAADGTILHSAQVLAFDRDRQGVVRWTPGIPVAHLADDLATLVTAQR